MKVFSTRMHAKIDYITGTIFLASPWIFGFTGTVPAAWTVIAVAAIALTVSLFTDYEGGIEEYPYAFSPDRRCDFRRGAIGFTMAIRI